jgi:hypothetical protein
MYRMRRSLDDIMLSLSDFGGPHEHNEDTELTWAVPTEDTEHFPVRTITRADSTRTPACNLAILGI